jgi:hypothetical protein
VSVLTAEQRWALVQRYGSVENARDEAIRRSPKLQDLWHSAHSTLDWGPGSGFWEVFWKRALPMLGIVDAADGTDRGYAEGEGLDDDVEPDPRSKPEPIPRATFWEVVRQLTENVDLRKIEDDPSIGLSYRKILKIRDYHDHPEKLGPRGGPGYTLNPGPTSATVVLRKLRKKRSC